VNPGKALSGLTGREGGKGGVFVLNSNDNKQLERYIMLVSAPCK